MAKPKRKKATAKKRAKPTALAQFKGLVSRRAVQLGMGAFVGLTFVVAAAVAVFAVATDASQQFTDIVASELPARKPPPAEPVVLRDEPEAMEPAIDPAPQPPATVAAPPTPRVQLPPAPSGALPWQKYAKSVPVETGPRVAIVIDDAGLDHHRTARIIALPGPLTISFLTYGEGLTPQVRAASAAGHELMVHVAMEATSRSMDPGPDVLLRDIEPDEILARLTRVLGKFDGYVGVNNHMGSLFTADRAAMQVMLGEIKRRGLLFLDSRTGPNTVGGEVSRGLQLPFAERDVFLDNEPTTSAVGRQLAELERIARARGAATAIGHPRDGTIDALARWIPDAKARGFVFVPVSAIVKDNIARSALSARR